MLMGCAWTSPQLTARALGIPRKPPLTNAALTRTRALRALIAYPTRSLLVGAALRVAEWRTVQGVPVGVVVPPGMDEEACYQRIQDAILLIHSVVPYRSARLRIDVRRILCFGTGRDAALGAYHPLFRACLVDPRHVLNSGTGTAQIARTILHEAVHARLHSQKVGSTMWTTSRIENTCARAERDLMRKITAREDAVCPDQGCPSDGAARDA